MELLFKYLDVLKVFIFNLFSISQLHSSVFGRSRTCCLKLDAFQTNFNIFYSCKNGKYRMRERLCLITGMFQRMSWSLDLKSFRVKTFYMTANSLITPSHLLKCKQQQKD